jgi:hypothetical protein
MKKCDPARYDYRLRMQVPMNSSQALLLKYLKHDINRVFSHREMVITAITAYWLVFAYRDAYQLGVVVSDAEMQSVVRDSIYRLNHQANYLQTFFVGKNMEQIQAANGQKLLPCSDSDLPNSSFQLLPED